MTPELADLLTVAVTVHHRAPFVDSNGERAWAVTVGRQVCAHVEPSDARTVDVETLSGQTSATETVEVTFPAGTVVGRHDLLDIGGDLWEVVGHPRRWTDATSPVEHHVEVTCRRTDG